MGTQLAAQVCMQCIRREFDADKAPLTSRCYMKANYRQPGMRHVIYIWLPDSAALDILNVFAIMPQQKRKRIGPSDKGVTKRLSMTNRDEPLPLGEGPKLTAFDLNNNTIEYVRLLNAEESSGHSHVFEVTIGARFYALKIVRPVSFLHYSEVNEPYSVQVL